MRLIDADALKENIKNTADLGGWIGAAVYHIKQVAIKYIDEATTVDAVEVVRCKDCRYYNTTNCCDGCGWCERSGMDRGSWDNWFCADGVRKEGE